MDKANVEEQFPCGSVLHVYSNNRVLTTLLRLVYVAIGTFALYQVQHTQIMGGKIIGYIILLFALWCLYNSGQPLLFLCERGLVVRRRPSTLSESIDSFCNNEHFYVPVKYEYVLGFTNTWDRLHVGLPEEGAIYIVLVELQYLNYKDKIFINEFIANKQKLEDNP